MNPELVVLAPRLLAQSDDALAASRPLAALARYTEHAVVARDIYAALFAALGLPPDTPIAPLALLGSGRDPGSDHVLCAQPAHVDAGAGNAVDVDAVTDLAPAEADTLVRMLDRHFAEDGLSFEAVRAGEWFARSRSPSDVMLTSPDAARGQPLARSLPRGADAARWKRWQDEISMLLHDHPINEAREASGQVSVNAVWLFGNGMLRDVRPAPPLSLSSLAPTFVGDLVRGLARLADPERADGREAPLAEALARVGDFEHAGAARMFTVAIAADGTEARALDDAIMHLERGDVAALHLVAAGRSGAITWTAAAPGFWRRTLAHLAPRRLEMPRADE
jgi:hypothetical protein